VGLHIDCSFKCAHLSNHGSGLTFPGTSRIEDPFNLAQFSQLEGHLLRLVRVLFLGLSCSLTFRSSFLIRLGLLFLQCP